MVVSVHVRKRIALHWVLRVACFGFMIDYRKRFSFCSCYGCWRWLGRRRRRRVVFIMRIVHMHFFLKAEYVSELYMVVRLGASSLKPISEANSSLPSICFCTSLRTMHVRSFHASECLSNYWHSQELHFALLHFVLVSLGI